MSPESVPCPSCSAPIGVECRRPNKRRAKVPHLERRQLAGCAIPTTGRPPTLIAVPCSLCGAPIGVRCMTANGQQHSSGHEVRRAAAGLTPRGALKIVEKARSSAGMSEEDATMLAIEETRAHRCK